MCTVPQCAQEIMGGEEVETAREDNLNSRESCCKRGPGSGVVGRWGYWTIEHTHHYSVDQESRPYFAGFSTSESHLKASTKVLAWAAVSLGVSAGDKILFQGHMTVGNITTEAVRQTSVSCSVRSSSQFLIMWLPPQGSS